MIYRETEYSFLMDFYQIINIFRDIDFCLKIYLIGTYKGINNEEHNSIDELFLTLMSSDPRFEIWLSYLKKTNKNNIFDQNTLNVINNTLTIKHFIILGDIIFNEKIKTIEKNIKYESFEYLNNINQISNYSEQMKKKIIKKFFLFFIF